MSALNLTIDTIRNTVCSADDLNFSVPIFRPLQIYRNKIITSHSATAYELNLRAEKTNSLEFDIFNSQNSNIQPEFDIWPQFNVISNKINYHQSTCRSMSM